MTLATNIWKTLSAINVNDHIEKKGNLSYLSWAWAWEQLMNHYADSYYYFDEKDFADGSKEVICILTIHEGEDSVCRQMWLPVMDHRNKAIINPDSRQVSDAKMRCLVKTLAMFGLGHYIYAGEDIPAAEKQKMEYENANAVITDDQAKTINEMMKESLADLDKFCEFYQIACVEMLPASKYEQAYNMLAKKIADAESALSKELDETGENQ
jgi:hypothetical protein